MNNAGTKAIDRKRWKEGFKRREKARPSEIERVKRERARKSKSREKEISSHSK